MDNAVQARNAAAKAEKELQEAIALAEGKAETKVRDLE